MTQPDDARDLPPEQDAVRRLLAEARHDEPVPPAVAARLDAVLAGLASERPLPEHAAPVVDLAARRRRGLGTALLAAAAVVVVGAGIGQVIDRSAMSDGGAAGSASDESVTSAGSGSGSEPDADAGSDAGAGAAEAPAEDSTSSRKDSPLAAAAPAVSSDSLRRDLRVAQRAAADLAGAPEDDPACPLPADVLTAGTTVAVTLDGRPALALYRVPQDGRQQVDVYLCETGAPARTVTLPAR